MSHSSVIFAFELFLTGAFVFMLVEDPKWTLQGIPTEHPKLTLLYNMHIAYANRIK